MKIPTVFGLVLIITSLSLGLIFYSFQKTNDHNLKQSSTPQNIKIFNLTGNQASITWQTNLTTEGEVELNGDQKNLKRDDRDLNTPTPHQVHFVTLKNLNPNTKYTYKIKSGNFYYPDYNLEFETLPQINTDNLLSEKNKFLRGTILNTNLNPIDEALVILKIDGAQEIASITGISGNFILPLHILSADGTNFLEIDSTLPATILVEKSTLKSNISLNLPLENPNLPPFTIGQSFNLSEYLQTLKRPSNPESLHTDISIYDLNSDGTLNSLDSAIVSDNINRKFIDKKADLNNDGKVDQKDLNLILKSLQ